MDIVEVLKTRFFENKTFHSDLQWAEVEKRFLLNPNVLEVLLRMEESGGEPDTIGFDENTGKLIFCDCSKRAMSNILISRSR